MNISHITGKKRKREEESFLSTSKVKRRRTNPNKIEAKKNDASSKSQKGKSKSEKRKKTYLLTDSLKDMMYAFGDVKKPFDDSAELMEDLVVNYCSQLIGNIREIKPPNRIIKVRDVVYQVRHDEKKMKRAVEISTKRAPDPLRNNYDKEFEKELKKKSSSSSSSSHHHHHHRHRHQKSSSSSSRKKKR